MARLENMRKYQDTRLLPLRNRKNEKSLLNKIRNPSFKYAHLLGKDFNWRPHGKGWICLKKLIPSTIHIVQLPDEQWINNKNEKPILKNTKVIARYREWYENKKELLENVENLYKLYYELSNEERIITEEEINNIREDLLRDDVIEIKNFYINQRSISH
ncbi:hypothetical protein RhiirA5_413248 [Rhizophagus irregularis]|uniref:Uncharacterized protein n=1 Tax=Rhizophagus irregularis TaxID=588596 RepID=A0A2N0PWT2_9GLOM|nr:hypothetical protein RhiirA5_413248 [Rhizophagus irregularis]